MRRTLGVCISSAAVVISSAAMAQSAPQNVAGVADEGDIIVTAQRRAERLQDVPISITAINGDALTKLGAKRLDDITALTPGLEFNHQGGFTQPTIRGVGTSIAGAGTGTNVGIYVDGFFLPNPLVTDMQLLNISSVQVLKGPQGTLFGRNTTGGAILIQTTEPSTTTEARAELSYGRFDAKSVQAYATTGLNDRVAVDVAALYRRGDGFVYNPITERKDNRYETWSIRAGVKAELTDRLSVLLRYSHLSLDDPQSQPTGVYCCNAEGRPDSVAAYIPGAITSISPNERDSEIQPQFRVKSDAVQLSVNADLDFADLHSYSQYRKEFGSTTLDLEESSAPLANFRFPYRDKIFTQEVILSSHPGHRLQWTTGAFFFQDKSSSNLDVSVSGAPFTRDVVRSIVTIQSIAGYADATYEIVDNLFLTGGIRISNDRYKEPHNLLGSDPTAVRVDLDPINSTKVTPRGVIRYQFDPRTSAYASYNQGYKSALRNLPAVNNAFVKPEKINAYEVGLKHAERVLSYNLSAFYYDYTNLQVSSYRGAISITNNAASSRIYGVEAEASLMLSPAFNVSAGGAYTNAKYKRYVNAPVYNQCLDLLACGAAYGTFPTASATIVNGTMQFAPKFTGHVSPEYKLALGGGELVASGTLSYQTKQFFDPAMQFSQNAHEKLALRVQWTDPTDHYTLAVYGDNITDRRYYVQVVPQSVAIPVSWNSPATWGVSISAKY